VVLFAAAHAAAAALAAAADFNDDFSSQQSTVDLPLHSTFWTGTSDFRHGAGAADEQPGAARCGARLSTAGCRRR